jgi:hydrogenase-4 component B
VTELPLLPLALTGVTVLLATAVLAVPAAKWGPLRGGPLVYGICLVVTATLAAVGLAGLLTGGEAAPLLRLPLGLPWLGANFRLDALSSFFLMVANIGAAAASLYAVGYGRHEEAPRRVLPFYAAFLAGIDTVVLADDAFTFLVGWEFMSLASWALVMARHREAENAHAGYVYLVMAAIGTMALLIGFGILAGPEGHYAFADMRQAPPTAALAGLVLAAALIGAGSKAGLVPLHAWLPLAHPAAPSHVSALMSGVMTKVAVYGFIRIVFDLGGPPAWWWGMAVLASGGITAVLGVLYALMQHDLKRLLAYHTVENIGIVFIGLGLGLAFAANGLPWAAALAVTAALFHVLNHMLFKSLLFFGAGAVLGATGERDMERLGGLIRVMPATAALFLLGSAAISALPPLNGFVSEWLTFQAVLASPRLPQWGLKLLVPTVGAMLAFSAALAAACFVKAFGITFLGRPRSDAARNARETDGFSIAAMALLGTLCVLAGVLPALVTRALGPAVEAVAGGRLPPGAGGMGLTLVPVAAVGSSYNGLGLLAFVAAAGFLTAFAVHRLASRRLRRAPAWDCGAPDPRPVTQYSAASFAQPIRRVFGSIVFRARETVHLPPPGDLSPARFEVRLRDLAWDLAYAPVAAGVSRAADVLNRLQFLTVRRYLALVFGALVLLLMGLGIWG